MSERRDRISPLTLFYSYAPADEALKEEIEKHLSSLQRQGLITGWHNRQIVAGTDWQQAIDSHLSTASVILLLVSPDFIASDYCYGVEMQKALARHRAGNAQVIPILLRPVDWEGTPFAHLQYLPRNAEPVTTWANRDSALQEVTQEIRQIVEGLLAPEQSLITRGAIRRLKQQEDAVATRSFHQHSSTSVRDVNRQRLLEKVYTTWIKGLLEPSLYGITPIALGLREEPDLVVNPWKPIVQEVAQQTRLLPPNTHIIEAYNNANGELLILGDPGAGKTTLLLELALGLLERAEDDNAHPMPIVFNLSSWAEKRQPLTSWFVEELNGRYQVPPKLAQSWVDGDSILPLLDSLDEVVPTYRDLCIEAINTYRNEHGLVPIVVCCRSDDYHFLPQRLQLRSAVIVQPLTGQQVNDYLESLGEQVTMLQQILHTTPTLQDLVTVPLMLSMLAQSYQEIFVENSSAEEGDFFKLRQRIFGCFADRMLKRRRVEPRYTAQQVSRVLTWLAQQMTLRSLTEFSEEQVEKNWLPERLHSIYSYMFGGSTGLVGGFLFGLLFGIISGLILGSKDGLIFGEIGGLVFGLIIGCSFSLDRLLDLNWINRLFIERIFIRYLLWRSKILPWNYIDFLNYAAEHILLRRIGNRYIFVHQMLLDYFATSDTPIPQVIRRSKNISSARG